MAATTFPVPAAPAKRSPAQTLAIHVKEAKYELINKVRIPVYAISTVLFPLMFYVLFGIVLPSAKDRADNATYLLATMGCFGVIAVALFGFGVSIAIERGQGWLQMKRASPMPVSAYFLAKLFAALVFSTAIMLLLLGVGIVFGGVHLPIAVAAKLLTILVAGSIPFSAMGLAIGYFAKPNSAPAVVNLIYLPMSFCSGLWIPLFMLPHGLQTLAKFLPPFHLAELALNAVGMGTNPSPARGHIEVLLAFTMVFLALAAWGYRRDEGKTYG
jgi:ABC-2 type transport system permease protein